MGCNESANETLRWALVWVAPSSNNNSVSLRRSIEPLSRQDVHASGSSERSAFQAAHLKAIPGIEFGPRKPEQLNHDSELEGAKAIVCECCVMRRSLRVIFGGPTGWHDIYDNWRLGHWQENRLTPIL